MATAPPTDDEPRSPLWLPALGAALFLLGGIWWLAFGNDEPKPSPSADQAASAAPSASAAASASAAPAAQPSPH